MPILPSILTVMNFCSSFLRNVELRLSDMKANSAAFMVAILCYAGFSLWSDAYSKTFNSDQKVRHVSSYQNINGARQEVDLLKSKGLKAYFEKVEIPEKGTWYRVFVTKGQDRRNLSTPEKKESFKGKPNFAPAKSARSAGKVNQSLIKPVSRGNFENKAGAQPQPAAGKNVPDRSTNHAQRPQDRSIPKGSDESDLKNGASFKSGYEPARAEFDQGHYEKAAAMLTASLTGKQMDVGLHEKTFRCLADSYYFLGKDGSGEYTVKAVEAYKNILRYYPDVHSGNDHVHFRLASCLEQLGNDQEAYRSYENILRSYPKSLYEQETLYKLGDLLYRAGLFAPAIERLRYYLSQYPLGIHASEAHFLIGYCFRQLNRQADAESWYAGALTRASNNFEDLPAEVLYDVGLYLFARQDYSQASTLFSLYLNLYPKGPWGKSALYNLGRSFYLSDHFPSALKVFSLLLDAYPESGEANESILFMANIGVMEPSIPFNVCMTGRDYFKNPVETYDRMREKYPGGRLEEWLLYQKGYALWKKGSYKDAFDVYCLLLDNFSRGFLQKESRAYLALNAKCFIEESYRKGDCLAVVDAYFKIRDRIPISSETQEMFFKIGISLRSLELFSDALLVLDSLRKASTDTSQKALMDFMIMEINYNLGTTGISPENRQAVKTLLTKYKGSVADMAGRNLAESLFRKGRSDEAISLYEFLKDRQGDAAVLPLEVKYAQALKNKDSCSSAISRYQAIIAKCGETLKCEKSVLAEAYSGLGDCYLQTSDYRKSVEMYQLSLPQVQEKENQLWTLYRMGQSYGKLDDPGMEGKIFSELKEKSGDPFWPKVADYWVADRTWSSNHIAYLRRN